jgi:hypothetical protein
VAAFKFTKIGGVFSNCLESLMELGIKKRKRKNNSKENEGKKRKRK